MKSSKVVFKLLIYSTLLLSISGCFKKDYEQVNSRCSSPFQASVSKVYSCFYENDVSDELAFKNMLYERSKADKSVYKKLNINIKDMKVLNALLKSKEPFFQDVSYLQEENSTYSCLFKSDNKTFEYQLNIPQEFKLTITLEKNKEPKKAAARYRFYKLEQEANGDY